jgi:O-antigen ligase
VHLPFRPLWRESLTHDLHVPLAATLSPQPLITLENLAWLAVMLLWLAWGISHWQTSPDRGAVIRKLSLGLSALALTSLLFHAIRWEPLTWQWGGHHDMGPFANRNHFACLMAMNTVLCLASAYDMMRQRKRRWTLYAVGMLPSFAVVLLIGSRAGLILFFCGVMAWFVASSVRRRSMQKMAIGGALLLALTAGLVLFGQQVLRRFGGPHASVVDGITDAGRLKVWGETLDLILQQPTLGVGLGNFASIFGMTNKLGEGFVRYRHPESDWLWFLAEAGWPATLACLLGLLLLLRWTGPWRQVSRSLHRRERRLRMAALLATLLAVGHGFVDVPNHDLPMALIVGLLASMAFYESRLTSTRGALVPRTFQALGGASMVAGLCWWGAGFGALDVMGQSSWQQRLAHAKKLSAQGDAKAAWDEIEKAVKLSPLSWEAWFMHAEIGL